MKQKSSKKLLSTSLLLVLIALLLSILIGVGSALLGGNTDPLSNVVNTVASPIRGGVSAVMDWAEGVYTYVFHYQELHDQLSDLQVKVSQLEEQVRQGEEASRENEQLRQLLQLQAKRRDTDIEMGGIVTRTYSAGILESSFDLMRQGRLKLSYLPEDAQLVSGDEVVTSGKGDVYPSGLVVGQVEGVFTDPSGMTRYAVVLPDVKLDSLVEVFVIKDFDIVE